MTSNVILLSDEYERVTNLKSRPIYINAEYTVNMGRRRVDSINVGKRIRTDMICQGSPNHRRISTRCQQKSKPRKLSWQSSKMTALTRGGCLWCRRRPKDVRLRRLSD